MSHWKLLAVGCDVEAFLFDPKKNKSVPVCGLLGGTKREPKDVGLGQGYTVQEDNVMVEYNIPASRDPAEFSDRMGIMVGYLRKFFKDNYGFELNFVSSELFDPEDLAIPQAQTFGCEPDFNAWTLEENEVNTLHPALRRLRTAGGHVHVSFTVDDREPELEERILLVKVLDLCLGVPSSFVDKDMRRKEFYGKAGAFRLKQYTNSVHGVEYRTLSNFWAKNRYSCKYLFLNVAKAFSYLNSNQNMENSLEECRSHLMKVINEGNTELAKGFMDNWSLNYLEKQEGSEGRHVKSAYQSFNTLSIPALSTGQSLYAYDYQTESEQPQQ